MNNTLKKKNTSAPLKGKNENKVEPATDVL